MTTHPTVLVVGGTGRTGRRVVQQLLERGARVRVVVRAGAKLPPEATGNPDVTVIEASLLTLSDAELQQHVRGCDAVISCLGHVLSLKGVFGPPRDLVTRAVTRLCRAIEASKPPAPIKLVLMSSVSVMRPGGLDTRRTAFERAFLGALCRVLPPAGDNQRAADFLIENIPAHHAYVEWAAVRPDTLLEGGVTKYAVHEGLVDPLFKPGSTNMANVAHFMCELVTDASTWAAWKGKLPVVVNVGRTGTP